MQHDGSNQCRELPLGSDDPNRLQIFLPCGQGVINFYYTGSVIVGGRDTLLALEFVREWTVINPKPAKESRKQRRVYRPTK